MTKKKRSGNTSLVFPNRMYVFLIPAMAFFLVFWIFPILQLFYYSVTNFNGINYDFDFVGMKNYIKIFDNGTLMNSAKNTLIYTVVMVICSNLIGLAVAMLLNMKIRAKGLFRTCAYFPALFSAIVVGFIWSYVYMPGSGMIAGLMNLVGLDGSAFNPLGNFKTALYAIAIVEIWKGFGTTMIIYLAGLQTVDESLLEAGRIDGCTEWQLIRKVKLPLISSTITINVILNVIAGLKAFDYSFIMTNGGPGKSTKTLMFQIYEMAFDDQKMGRASAFSVMSFLLIILITVFMLYFLNKREVEL
ncbi:carbohydrate ABC transporter permease [Ruminococcus sp. 5_1_39BFAA]|uniref:carbohydrate ABC transporter permease n=1 Tax=Ruminococcus sp. 5_1_39BFAA TaxID=457412 RepID=UPI00356133DE